MGGGSSGDLQVSNIPVVVITNLVNGASASPITLEPAATAFTQAKSLTSTATSITYSSSISTNGIVLSTLAIACIIIGSIFSVVLALVALISAIHRHRVLKSAVRQHDRLASIGNDASNEPETSALADPESPDDFATMSRINLLRTSTTREISDIHDLHQYSQDQLAANEQNHGAPPSPTRSHPNWSVNSFPSSATTAPTSRTTQYSHSFEAPNASLGDFPPQHITSRIDDHPDWNVAVRPLGIPSAPSAAHNRVNPFAPTVQAVARAYLAQSQSGLQRPHSLPTPSPMLIGDDIGVPLVLRYQCAGTVLSPLSSRPAVTRDMLQVIQEEHPTFETGSPGGDYDDDKDEYSSVGAYASPASTTR
ncbi:hypothetical protein HDU83_006365 [Entophlyctis luteolus]|nr:hypothetical protein HDU83_006365 [Entophlyctis luteolus]